MEFSVECVCMSWVYWTDKISLCLDYAHIIYFFFQGIYRYFETGNLYFNIMSTFLCLMTEN